MLDKYSDEDETETEEKNTVPASKTYSGSGDSVVTLDDFGDWFIFEIDGNAGSDYFGVIAYDASGDRLGSLVNTTNVYHGRVYDGSQSATMLEVKATGSWTIKVLSLYSADYALMGDTVTGSGDDVLMFYTDKGESRTAHISGNLGGNYFGVIGYNGNGSRTGSLVNTTDPYEGTVMLKENTRIIEVKAEDNWSITFE